MAAKKKAAKAGGGAVAAGKAVKDNEYVQRLIEDEDLRENLRTAFDSSKKAYSRISNGKGPQAVLDDKKTQKELKEAASAMKEAADALRGGKKKKGKRRGGLLLVLVVGGIAAVALNEGLRKKVLDTLFGAEEEFEYTSTTTPQTSNPPSAPVGTS